MKKISCFYIDDVIWCFRDVARQRPESLFDNPFFGMLKHAHDEYGATVQLNLFYRTDFFYGSDEFTLRDMPDCYKAEFEEASSWLRFAFHGKQEFPDYPYINAKYDDVMKDYADIIGEICRFAGEGSVAHAIVSHWLPVSREACLAFRDSGVTRIAASSGEAWEYTGDESVLPYGHAARLLQNRQPETKLYTRPTKDLRIANSICGYNHLTEEEMNKIYMKDLSYVDEATGCRFCGLGSPICLNLETLSGLPDSMNKCLGCEYFGIFTHEQYFYPDYLAYQPDYAEKFYLAAKMVRDAGYTFVNSDDLQ
jgi:hypothetical protein